MDEEKSHGFRFLVELHTQVKTEDCPPHVFEVAAWKTV